MSSYESALNASNTEAAMPLYAEDGVFMAPNNQSAVGKASVRQAYDAVFKPSPSRSNSPSPNL
jgi:ketosteroid isomerase-like protein